LKVQRNFSSQARFIAICATLAAITWTVFGRTIGHDFVNYDDGVYVYQNPVVRDCLTRHGIVWAFTQPHAGNWHPLTTVSHMLDCAIFGLKPGGHHFSNLLLHTLAVLSLFLVLQKMTGGPPPAQRGLRPGGNRTGNVWRSAFVAAVFAIHPLHVESVAWISERKDVLSALFFMLILGAYAHYARKPSLGRYVVVAILFVCGLMSKSMLVTVPFVLLFLDYWPLGRIQRSEVRGQTAGTQSATFKKRSWARLIAEKIPLFALSIACGLITFVIQERAAGSLEQLPLGWRINNAIVSCVTYIGQMFWPARLAVFYPHPEDHLTIWHVGLALAFLIAITALVFALRKTRPYLLVGWLWYLTMLLPVIGIVQVGLQGHADRYTYLPQIGLYIGLTWLIADLLASFRYRRQILATASMIVIAVLSACAWKQTSYWRNSESLWTYTLAVTSGNETAHTNFGMFLLERGQIDDAISHLETALQILSRSGEAHYNLSRALVHSDLGEAFVDKGSIEKAITHLQKAVALKPDYPDAHYNLGSALSQKGDIDQAIAEWRTTLSLRPDDAGAHTSLGNALLQKGDLREAVAHYQAAIEVAPNSILPLNNLAWVLSTCPDSAFRNGPRAIELAQRAVQLSDIKNPVFIRTLAAAYAEAGRFPDAIKVVQRALELAQERHDADLAHDIEKDIEVYRTNSPLRDPTLNGK
jgi:tetratricopeptide (TPR) repeat protein